MIKQRNLFSSLIIKASALVLTGLISFNAAAQTSSNKFLWENPSAFPSGGQDCRFIHSVSTYNALEPSFVFWQDIDKSSSNIYIAESTSIDGINWSQGKRITPAIQYSGEIPELYSVAGNTTGIAVCALTSSTDISVFFSEDQGESYEEIKLPAFSNPLIAPRIYSTSGNGFIIFVSLAKNEEFSILYSVSSNGRDWSEYKEFSVPAQYTGSSSPFVPFLLQKQSGDLVVYQSRYASGDQLSFQLFSSVTKDGGKTWSKPVMVTDKNSLLNEDTLPFDKFNNQRPYLFEFNDKTYMAWERKAFTSSTSDIICAELTQDGKLTGNTSKLNTMGNCSRPQLFSFDDNFYALWFDSLRGNEAIYLSNYKGTFWDDEEVLAKNKTTFPVAIVTGGSSLSFVWQETGKNSKITQLVADHSAKTPRITASNFINGRRYATDKVSLKLTATDDPSGIQGFSWIWTQNPDEEPPETINLVSNSKTLELKAQEDGSWYFKAKQQDFAGNWSSSTQIEFIRDTTPPLPPVIQDFNLDKYGLAKSNSLSFNWQPQEEDTDIAGYTWSLEYIDAIPKRLAVNASHPLKLSEETVNEIVQNLNDRAEKLAEKVSAPPKYIRGSASKTNISWYNRTNGVYVFSVAGIDTVGNIGEASKIVVIANKYIPSTFINAVNSETDDYGNLSVEIIGGGFTYEGTISALYLDKDGKAPYDYIFSAANEDFKIASDSRITDLNLSEIEAGEYRIGLIHTDRGLYFTAGTPLSVQEYGTVKSKYFVNLEPAWTALKNYYSKHTNVSTIVLVVLAAFFLLSIIGSVMGLTGTAKEAAAVKAEVTALIEGGTMPNEGKTKVTGLKKKGMGLRAKLTVNSMMLVIVINLLLIITFRIIITQTEEQTLSKGLYDRVNVILNSIDSGAKVYLPLNDNMSLQDTVNQISALSEAEYATITSYSEDEATTSMDYVWATTDSQINSKIDTESWIYGRSRLTDEKLSEIIEKECAVLNAKATEALGDIPVQLAEVTKEAQTLLSKTDEESISRRNELDEIRKQLIHRMDRILSEVSAQGTGSVPYYDSSRIDRSNTSYLFYKPVLYRHGTDQSYVHGMIFVSISTESLIAEMDAASRTILIISGIMLVVAIILALLSSLLLSSVIIRPINILVDHVSMIRDTEDKEKLEGKDLKLKSKDEIGMLGETVNEMTQGLVEAAKASKNLTIGKEVQTKFIPLQIDDKGNTLTTGQLKANGADFFSYYAGADDLSGDYFDYKQIDNDHYAVIKCDVSGHGVPAALIMVEVATLFLNYFQNWSMKNPQQGYNLAPVVGHINDLLESRGFKGRFAAFTLAIINTRTGECHFCNAGDNLIHIYDGASGKKKIITLQETPAAGMFSTDLVDMKGGYKVSKLMLKKDDILFLYTDGIEEAKRLFRNKDYELLVNKESENKDEDDGEELGPERVTEIIESVYHRREYKLTKLNNPDEIKELVFDFTTCEPTAESAIMALVAVEKVFRMYKPKEPKPSDKVKCDTKIDGFLRMHFKQYGTYCSQRSTSEVESNIVFYNGVQQDPQYDDLTLIAIKKN